MIRVLVDCYKMIRVPHLQIDKLQPLYRVPDISVVKYFLLVLFQNRHFIRERGEVRGNANFKTNHTEPFTQEISSTLSFHLSPTFQ